MIHKLGRIDEREIDLVRTLTDVENALAEKAIDSIENYFLRHALLLTERMFRDLNETIQRVAPGSAVPISETRHPDEVVFHVASRLVLWLDAFRILNTTETRIRLEYGHRF